MDPQNPGLTPGGRIGGHIIQRMVELPEIQAVFYELTHPATGARHLHISNKDRDNAFSVAFKTVPEDATGVAHILEHTVLCGSSKYPVRDPFFSMIKRSLNSFMNAFTSSDWTMYPFSAYNRKDYFNLMGVYLDAAFFPLLEPLSFKQEGHRLEFEPSAAGAMGRLVYKGVVYNEMKGAMSSPDQVMSRSILNALYPDTTYRFNAGGDPAVIPSLTHAQLVAFHQRHYHPGNAFFYTYGDLPLEERLAFIEENVLSRFGFLDPKTDVPSQPRWEAPRAATYVYPIDESEDPAKKSQVCLSWLVSDIRDAFEMLVLTVLEQVLLGNSGSPLRQALIESGLGSALSDGTGFDGENKDTLFSVGLKDVDSASAEAIEKIIMNTLSELTRKGVNRELVDSALHQIEFHQKEITHSPYPYGVKLLLRLAGTWFHHGDPISALKFDDLIHRFLAELDKGNFLESRIHQYFLDNPHRVRLILEPDPTLASKESLQEAERLKAAAGALTPSERKAILEDTQALVKLQESKEDLSCLPTLGMGDIPPDIQTVDETKGYSSAITTYELPTSGIFYLNGAIGLAPLPSELLDFIPLFCHALMNGGTAKHSHGEIAHLTDLYTGGMGLSAAADVDFREPDGAGCLPLLRFSAKCLSRNQGRMFDLIAELLADFAFTDHERLKQLLLEYRSEMESAVVSGGHRFALSLASRELSTVNALNEHWHGIHQLKFLKGLAESLTSQRLADIAHHLGRIARCLLTADNIRIGVMGEDHDLKEAARLTEALLDQMGKGCPEGARPMLPPTIPWSGAPVREGWYTATAVSFVASVFPTISLTHADAPSLSAIAKLLRSLFLHREIREKGGAYGGFAIYQPENGLFCFASYRDPHIQNTLGIYEAAEAFITSGDFTDTDITEAVLQVCADIDKPDTPSTAARKAFYRRISGITDEMRKTFKERLLSLNRQVVLEAARHYFGPTKPPSSVAVISNEEALRQAAATMPEGWLAMHRI